MENSKMKVVLSETRIERAEKKDIAITAEISDWIYACGETFFGEGGPVPWQSPRLSVLEARTPDRRATSPRR